MGLDFLQSRNNGAKTLQKDSKKDVKYVTRAKTLKNQKPRRSA